MVADQNQETHVLMVSAALQGHLNPLLKFAKCLISKGIHVTLVTTELARHRMLKHAAAATNPLIKLEFFSDGLDVDFNRESDYDLWLETLKTKGRENFSNLTAKLSQHTKFSCLILHQFVPWFIPVAKEHNIPCAVLWIQPCALYSIYYRFFNKLNDFSILHNPERLLELPGHPLMEIQDIPSFILPNIHLCFQKLLAEFFEYLVDVKWVLGTSFEELEEEVLGAMVGDGIQPTVTTIGPLVSRFLLGKKEEGENGVSVDMWKADESCLRWLDGKEIGSVVYVSFGSIIVLGQEQVDNIAMGLLNSGKPFLWVFKRTGASNVELPSGFLEAVGDRGLVVNWCSQEQVLKHKAVGCFLTHCGWNSTQETVVTGVPVIAFPEWTDQPTNAKLLTDVFKMGVRMRKGDDGIVSPNEVERCIKEITEGPAAEAMAKRAEELKVSAMKAVEDGGSSHRNLEKFIADIVG
ncbi:UDP-glycosyltransferase 84B2-like [Cucumis melo var. makuwa]|uniref:Glycosyltransferase n=1 Tax=Cucumis melo var. makuwa TaxID=1194695 RepID=A0A5A7VL19_CUCMM|nr:UDP-glycosyltransferase 84B2-like [Cucumis melo var. makuwa]